MIQGALRIFYRTVLIVGYNKLYTCQRRHHAIGPYDVPYDRLRRRIRPFVGRTAAGSASKRHGRWPIGQLYPPVTCIRMELSSSLQREIWLVVASTSFVAKKFVLSLRSKLQHASTTFHGRISSTLDRTCAASPLHMISVAISSVGAPKSVIFVEIYANAVEWKTLHFGELVETRMLHYWTKDMAAAAQCRVVQPLKP